MQVFNTRELKCSLWFVGCMVKGRWRLKLRDERQVILRFLKVEDRDSLYQCFLSMSEEALEWSMAPYTMDSIQRWVDSIPNRIPLVAEFENRIVGYAGIYKFPQPRRKGIGDLAIYLHQDFHNVGLGTAMTERLLGLARRKEMHKIELQVVADNTIAIRLYKRFNFKVEGISEDSFFGSDGNYHDMVHMGLVLT
jgi:RimJ/RimL family protein N-acetyltransferase